jgi:error-prone DNA polymerase
MPLDPQALIRHAIALRSAQGVLGYIDGRAERALWRDTFSRKREKDERRLHRRHESMRDDIRSTHALRLGFREVNGLRKEDMERLVAVRGRGYDSVRDLWLRTGLSTGALERLAEADAFRSIGLDRREALWAVRGLNRAGDKDDLPLFRAAESMLREPDADLPPMPLGEHVVEDYQHLSLSLKAHPVAFVRTALAQRGILKNEALADMPPTSAKERLPRVTISGLVLVRQRPGTGKGVIFMTIEDETGIANIIVWPKIFEKLRSVVIGARFVAVTGRMQRESEVIHVIAERIVDLTSWLGRLARRGAEHIDPRARVDEAATLPEPFDPQPRAAKAPAFSFMDEAPDIGNLHRVLPKGRNFH